MNSGDVLFGFVILFLITVVFFAFSLDNIKTTFCNENGFDKTNHNSCYKIQNEVMIKKEFYCTTPFFDGNRITCYFVEEAPQ